MDDHLLRKAEEVYNDNFKPVTWFERAIFFSWYCSIGDCKFCYMSTQPKNKRTNVYARRRIESILAEVLICKKLGWELGFVSGGIGAYRDNEFLKLIESIHKVYKEKFWINVGTLSKTELKRYLPYIKGVVGSIETVNPEVHEYACPSKPIKPYLNMFQSSTELGLKNAATIIIGLGETSEDFGNLKDLIKDNNISKMHFYGLNPQKGTAYENANPPSEEYQAEWIARARIEFPKLDIQMGIWVDRVNRVSTLLKAGSNSISKFPSIRYFGTEEARQIELESKKAGREFLGTMTQLPKVDWIEEIEKLDFDRTLKENIKIKLFKYLKKMEKNHMPLIKSP